MNAEYVDHMGTDLSVVNAAKVSFANRSDTLSVKEIRLIYFLARGCTEADWKNWIQACCDIHDERDMSNIINELKHMATHWTPFTHTAISIRMKAPVPIRTQCFKHKVGFTENEESRRYIQSTPELHVPEYFRSAPEGNIKQGSAGKHPDSDSFLIRYRNSCSSALALYEDMVKNRVCPEQARFVLPQGVYVNWIWTGNLAAFARYYNQRTDSHAQEESQVLAKEVGKIVQHLFPISWEALTR